MKQQQKHFFILALLLSTQTSLQAAPGSLAQTPLFISAPIQPNIMFMLDDSGSMHWSMPSDGVQSSAIIEYKEYDISPDDNTEWYAWCPGANLMAYDPSITYKPWSANIPGTSTPFPDQSDITSVWVDPLTQGAGSVDRGGIVQGDDSGTVDLSDVPIVQWTDSNGNGQYDTGECPTSFGDARAVRASSLSPSEQTNFANWFTYYRIREHAAKAAVTRVISTSSARMGMATLHHHNNVGKEVTDMMNSANKEALLTDVVNMDSSGGTPLRQSLEAVGHYFAGISSAPRLYLGRGSHPSPILPENQGGACQQNFVMLMTDGQWNGPSPGVGDQDDPTVENVVYEAHRDATPNTLADVAMKWYKTDLSTSLPNKVPIQTGNNTLNLDENNQQHLVTFGVAFGPTGTIDHDPVDRNQPFAWPVPVSNRDTTVDDLRHAAYNGRGQFLSAKKPQTLIKALEDVIADIESRQGSSSAVAFNMSRISSLTQMYYAGFNTTNWTGQLNAFSLDPSTGDIIATADWEAGPLLDARTDSDMLNNRVIYTLGTDSAGDRDGVLFDWSISNPQPATTTEDDLKINADATVDVSPFTVSQARLDFVRGNRSNEDVNGTGLFRERGSRLGDIINSAPVYVGGAESNWPDSNIFGGSTYSTYQSGLQVSPREPMVYVGANDGLLHGFSATSGQEVMAYAPGAVASTANSEGLHYLTEKDYSHRYYVDGEFSVADAYIKRTALGTPDWRTILIGSLRGGGQGLFALDVTEPGQYTNTNTAAKSTVLWEFTNQDDADLGFTFATPEIVMMNNHKWAVITGNGYNATGTDTAQLMILFIEEGVDGQWSAGDYIKLDTNVGSVINKNGLSTPATIDLDNDGTTDRIYAGDLHGNMWTFDVSDSLASNWKIAHDDGNGNPQPLFAAGTTKPITMKPLLVKPDANWLADTVGNAPNIMVYFGTGQYMATGDASSTSQQTFYGLRDIGTTVPANQIVEQTFLPAIVTDTRLLTTNSVDYQATTPDLGWFINLPEQGERVVVEAFDLEGLIYFNTMTPSETPCSAGGTSWLMSVDMKTGGTPSIVSFDFNHDGVLSAADTYAAGIRFKYGMASKTTRLATDTDKNYGYTSGTDNSAVSGNGPPVDKQLLPGSLPPATGQRQSWIQLIND